MRIPRFYCGGVRMARWFADTGGYKTAWLGTGNHVRVFRRGNLFFSGDASRYMWIPSLLRIRADNGLVRMDNHVGVFRRGFFIFLSSSCWQNNLLPSIPTRETAARNFTGCSCCGYCSCCSRCAGMALRAFDIKQTFWAQCCKYDILA